MLVLSDGDYEQGAVNTGLKVGLWAVVMFSLQFVCQGVVRCR